MGFLLDFRADDCQSDILFAMVGPLFASPLSRNRYGDVYRNIGFDSFPGAGKNFAEGTHLEKNTKNCLVINRSDRTIATVGVNDLIIVDTPDALLICHQDDAQSVKDITEQIDDEQK